MSLYNEVRPTSLEDVRGQENIKAQLSAMFANKKIPNAMLFIGPRGTGKTTVARIVSRYVNCEEGEAEPCNECLSCKSILNGTSLDVVELDAASHNGVADVHQIIEQAQLAPNGKHKIFILDEVHMFSDSAWNALLKTLEEPPKGVIFILCTTEEHKVPATIISRCRKFHFEKIDLGVIVDAMKDICEKYGKAYEEDALLLIARASEGCMRDALSILESFFDIEGLCVETVMDALGSSKEDVVFDILTGISSGNVRMAIEALRLSDKRGASLKGLVKNLILAVTDTLFLLQGADVSSIIGSAAYKERLTSYKDIADIDGCLELTRRLSDCYGLVSRSDDVEFLVENSIIEAISSQSKLVLLEKRVEELEKKAVLSPAVNDGKEEELSVNAQVSAPIEEQSGFTAFNGECPFEEDIASTYDMSGTFSDSAEASDTESSDIIPFDEGIPSPVVVEGLPEGTEIAGMISLSDVENKTSDESEETSADTEDAGDTPKESGCVLPFGPGGFSGWL